jgi:hypothetical protein
MLLELKTLKQFEVSPWTDLTQTIKNVPEAFTLCVSLHPNDILFTTLEKIEKKIKLIKATNLCLNFIYLLNII